MKHLKINYGGYLLPILTVMAVYIPAWQNVLVGYLIFTGVVTVGLIWFFQYLKKTMQQMKLRGISTDSEEFDLCKHELSKMRELKITDILNIVYLGFFLTQGWWWCLAILGAVYITNRVYFHFFRIPD